MPVPGFRIGYLVWVPRLRTAVVAERQLTTRFPARKTRRVEDFTTTLPGNIDPSVFASLPAPGGALLTPDPTPAVPKAGYSIVNTTPINGPPVADAGDAPSEPVVPLPELIDSDAEDDEVPATVEDIRRDALRTLERRRKLAALTPPPYSGGGETNRLLDLYGAENEELSETKKTIPAMSSMVTKKPGHCTRTYHKKNFWTRSNLALLQEQQHSAGPHALIAFRRAAGISSSTQTERTSTGIAD